MLKNNNISYSFTSDIAIPLWFYNSFLQSLSYILENDLKKHFITTCGYIVNPLLQEELNLLAIILKIFQTQILQKQTNSNKLTLKINVPVLKKEILTHKKYKHTDLSLFRFLTFLPSLKIHCNPSYLYTTTKHINLFTNMAFEQYDNFSQNDLNSSIIYELDYLTKSIILGITDPYYELIQLAKEEISAVSIIGKNSTLQIPKALWLDLNCIEQITLLKIQKTIQNVNNCLHFDGIFGEYLNEIIPNIKLLSFSKLDKTSPSKIHLLLKFLQNFGKKLVHHGILKSYQTPNFLVLPPFNASSSNILLGWQLPDMELNNIEKKDYQKTCIKRLASETLQNYLEDLVLILSSKHDVAVEFIKEIKDILLNQTLEDDIFYVVHGLQSSCPITALELFIEWYLRAHFNHIIKLSDVIKNSEIYYIINKQNLSIAEKFQQFLLCFKDNDSQINNIFNDPSISITHILYEKNDDILSYLKSFKTILNKNSQFANILSVQPNEVIKNNLDNKITNDSQHEQNKIIEIQNKNIIYKQLKKLAADELTKLKTQNPHQYSKLKKTYIESLEPTKKKLILELQKQMQEDMFDNHLKYGLLKFMVENPYCWTSSDISSYKPSSKNKH